MKLEYEVKLKITEMSMIRYNTIRYKMLFSGFLANSKYKIQALFKDFQGPKLHFSSTKIINKKPYPRRGHSKFRLQCDTEQYSTVLTNTVTCVQVLASKMSTNAKFQNLQDLNSRTLQGFSSTFKHLICFQALSRALKSLFQIQAFPKISQARYEPCIFTCAQKLTWNQKLTHTHAPV